MMLFVLTWVGLDCWIVCFWRMHRIKEHVETVKDAVSPDRE
jgi:hypothetical protein